MEWLFFSYTMPIVSFPRVLGARVLRFDVAPYYEVKGDGLDTLAELKTGGTSHISDLLRRAGEPRQALIRERLR
jgi:hypothetical protein